MGILRLLLALSIVIHHSYPLFGMTLLGRDPALKAFYIISGFYMSLILNEKYVGKNGGYSLFITNRFFRIFPAYWLILFLTIAFNYFFLQTNFFMNSFSNILNDLTLLIRTDYLQINTNFRQPLTLPIAYTLVLELCFYVVAPFIARRKKKFLLIISSLALVIHFIVFMILRLHHEPTGDWFFPEVIIYFLLGVLAYKIYQQIKNKKISSRWVISLFSITILSTLFYAFIPIYYHVSSIFTLKEWLYILLITISVPFIFKLTNKMQIDRLLGELSYPIYLSHSLIIVCLLKFGVIQMTTSLSTLIIIIYTILFSCILYYLLEKPIERFRQRRVKGFKS